MKFDRFAFVLGLSACVARLSLLSAPAQAQEPFSKIVGDVAVKDVKAGETMELPFILWGGDVATFYANGGLETKEGSLFAKQGLKFKLTPGDDFAKQVKAYLSGQTPFLRGTLSMLAQASEVLNADPRTKPVVFLQMTWSVGDHMVARADLKTLNDLKPKDGKKKRVALQKVGPHVGMFDDALRSAKLSWGDIDVVWTDDVTGPKGPSALFKSDPKVDACFAITPDMIGLTGGLDVVGTGAEGTVKGAHVLVSTASLSRSIADVYACRKDFYDAHKETVEKLAASYLKGCEELIDIKQKAANKEKPDKDAKDKYAAILKMAMSIYGKEALPDELSADGLISDASFVGLQGNAGFFNDPTNLSGFAKRQEAAMTAAVALTNAKAKSEFLKADFGDYSHLKDLGKLESALPNFGKVEQKFSAELEPAKLDTADAIVNFTIGFDPDLAVFDEERYGPAFQQALENASTFGNAVLMVRGHADLSRVLSEFVRTGLDKGSIKRVGSMGNYQYFLADGSKFDLADTKKLVDSIQKLDQADTARTVDALRKLSDDRSAAVRQAIIKYASSHKIRLDESQIKTKGVGILEPIVPQPRSLDDMAKNRRVEFRLVKVPLESSKASDLAY